MLDVTQTTADPLSLAVGPASLTVGDLLLDFRCEADGADTEVRLLPLGMKEQQVVPRARMDSNDAYTNIDDRFRTPSRNLECPVRIHLAEDRQPSGFTQGRTLCTSPSTQALQFAGMEETSCAERPVWIFHYTHPRGLRLRVHWESAGCGLGFRVWTDAVNEGSEVLTLELLTSFHLGGITPFARDDAPGRLYLHRFRSSWSSEGRHCVDAFEDVHLEPSWVCWNMESMRIGQVGSMPVRGFFPTLGIEDREAGVFWGARLAWPGSWQMEVLRAADNASLTGGLADYEFGHWRKRLQPGACLRSPEAFVTAVQGASIDDLCGRLLCIQEEYALPSPVAERNLPVCFNDWCTHWGEPDEPKTLSLARQIAAHTDGYFVIDAGWSDKLDGYKNQESNGDWEVHPAKFPDGFSGLNRKLRAQGLIPGIWFEFEVCTEGSHAYGLTDHHLTREGRTLEVGDRHFWDFRDPWVTDYLRGRLIDFLRENDFGYLKVDYNMHVGLGCDSPDGLGEGLRQHMEATVGFLELLREELPGLVVENCSSGGHRLEPCMAGVTSLSSFSDAHETLDVPIIAAQVQRHIPAHRSLIWAVLREADDARRLNYSLAAGFLGRICLSGYMDQLSPEQWHIVDKALALYDLARPVLRNPRSRLFTDLGKSWRHPSGWQALTRISPDGQKLLVVQHNFAPRAGVACRIPLPAGKWRIESALQDAGHHLEGDHLCFDCEDPFHGHVVLLTR